MRVSEDSCTVLESVFDGQRVQKPGTPSTWNRQKDLEVGIHLGSSVNPTNSAWSCGIVLAARALFAVAEWIVITILISS
jgi:hypothetical protein